MNRKSQHGIALVITLIMLAVVTVMAVLFLGISRRERASVNVTANLTDARLAADAAQARALSELIGQITAQSNLFAYDFRVSTNFISPSGFNPNLATPNLTNVSYTYASGQLLNNDTDIRKNLLNLYYDPRPPVFVVTNITNGATDFRFYLDLNRNGRFDTNGFQRIINTNGVVLRTSETSFYWGDPEWIGILEHPDRPHSATNRFIGRYAFVVVPAGKTLDINFLHNNAKNPNPSRNPPALPAYYYRNEGVGSWEINLAAFLRELNTNRWNAASYVFNPLNNNLPCGGYAFSDAFSILTNRYQGNWTSLKSAQATFGPGIANLFQKDQIDIYSDGPLMTGLKLTNDTDNTALPWPGSYNTNGYFSVQELFDPSKTSPFFVARLQSALATAGTYNQNTFDRLMAQLGTDSLPANRLTSWQVAQLGLPSSAIVGKLNLNYDNVNTNTGAIDPNLTANFVSWTPLRFFTNAADLMLRSQSGGALAIGKIPLYPTNMYSASVHRLLQIAANVHDATTNRFPLSSGTNIVYAPSVFRPLFSRKGTNIFIAGYQEVAGTNFLSAPWIDLSDPVQRLSGIAEGTTNAVNVYGVPLVIGAKKGLPNFNECLLESSAQVTRRMQAVKDSKANVTFQQAYEIGVSNYLALEAWNSYTRACPFAVDIILTNRASLVLSNESNPPLVGASVILKGTNLVTPYSATIPAGTWSGRQFQVPLKHLEVFVPDQEFHFTPSPPHLELIKQTVSFDGSAGFPVPNWKLYITNRLVFAVVAKDLLGHPHIVDFVNPGNMIGGMDISRALVGRTNAFSDAGGGTDRSGMFWQTNRLSSGAGNRYTAPPNSTWGITNQLWVSITNVLSDREWKSYSSDRNSGQDREKAIDGFRVFLGLQPIFNSGNTNLPPGVGRVMQVPFTPTRKLDQQLSWQVNDPLVHYTLEDLYDPYYADTNNIQPLLPGQNLDNNIGKLNERFRPWGGKSGKDPSGNALAYDVAVKDPLITQSDDWDFPTNKFPNIGWLGRVHRGTPWQTVYLKSPVEPVQTWAKWAGRADTHPTNDWHLLGLFTTALNDNAARGLLSVNQTNAAAWSAELSGVSVLTNTLAKAQLGAVPAYANTFIEPASWQMQYMVTNMNATRLQQPGRAFSDLGSVLASPALTVASPYLNLSQNQTQYGIRDEVYERIPQQVLSLLKEDEPYVVIYAFGQSLRPAENSIVRTPGPFRGLCTNYEVTGEAVTKTAVRIVKDSRPKVFKAVVESYNILPAD